MHWPELNENRVMAIRVSLFTPPQTLALEDDLIRRDLTINAMAEGHDGSIIDPHRRSARFGQKYSAMSPMPLPKIHCAFCEWPVLLRAIITLALASPRKPPINDGNFEQWRIQHLVAERVWKETDRALCERSPDIYIQVLRDCGALALLFPEVEKLFGVAQRADYHPEVDTGIHILMSLQQAARLSDSSPIRFSVLVHDLGKGITPDHVLPSHSGHEARDYPL